jgi:hypothetical protein
MGLMNLLGILETDLPLAEKVSWHLTSNCYPPVSKELHPMAVLAINLCSDGKPNELVSLPIGYSFRGQQEAPAYDIVDGLHLDLFVEYKDTEGEESG